MVRTLAWIAFVSLFLAAPAAAATGTAGVGYELTFSGTNTSGTITGTIGGVPVQGTYSGGKWTVSAEGKPFAAGTYQCGGTCTMTGTTVAGKSVSFTLSGGSLNGTKSGVLPASAFPTHGAWVSSVAQWANKNLEPGDRGKVVREAARTQGTATGSGRTGAENKGQTSKTTGDEKSGQGKDGNGKDADRGGGNDRGNDHGGGKGK